MVAGMAEAGQSYDEPLHGEEEGHPHQDCYPPKLHYGEFPLSRQRLNIIVQNSEVQKFSRSKRPPGYFTFP
jgi:hypothetical protein